jgi:hypothetical protein
MPNKRGSVLTGSDLPITFNVTPEKVVTVLNRWRWM